MKLRLAALLALAVVTAACGSGDESVDTTTTSTTTTTVETTTTTTGPATTTSESTTTTTLAGAPPFDTWTVILASLPTNEDDREGAVARLEELALDDGGVLLSDDYPSLNPGYWVVYSGVFETDTDAISRCADLSAAGIACYHRYLGASPAEAPVLANGQYLTWVQSDIGIDLAAVSVDTGEVVRTIAPAWADGGIYPGPPSITTDGKRAYFDIGYEDSWYSCESTLGEFAVIDLATAAWEVVGTGYGPVVSPDGRHLAYLAAERCLPDPEQPDSWFIAYHGTVVNRDLTDGSERRWKPSAAIVDTPASFVWGMGWNAAGTELYLALDDGQVRVLSLDTPTSRATDALPVLPLDLEEALWVAPVGRLADGDLVVRWASGPGTDPVFHAGRFDPVSGTMRSDDAAGSDWVGAALDATHSAVLIWQADSVTSPTVTVAGPGRWVYGADW